MLPSFARMVFKGLASVLLLNVMILLAMGAGTPNRHLTFFSNRRVTWNHAVEICEATDSQLIAFDSEDVYSAITDFSNGIWKDTWTDVWTGLHNVAGREPLFLWQGSCTEQGTYQPWDELEMPEIFRCVEADSRLQPGNFLENSACSYIGAKALCERKQGSCTFRMFEECDILLGPETMLKHLSTEEDCRQACLDHKGDQECWAVEFEVQAKTFFCHLYHDTSSAAMRDRILNDGTGSKTIYQKHCFTGAINTTILDVKFNSHYVDEKPWKGCSIGDIPATTTEESITSPYSTTVEGTTTVTHSTTSATSMEPTDERSSTVAPVTNATTATFSISSVSVSYAWTNATSRDGVESTSGTPPQNLTTTTPKSLSTLLSSTSQKPLPLDVTTPTTPRYFKESTPQFNNHSTIRLDTSFTPRPAPSTPSLAVETMEPFVPQSSPPDLGTSSNNQESSHLQNQPTLDPLSSLLLDAALLETSEPQVTVTQYVTLTKHVPIFATSSASPLVSALNMDEVTSSDFQVEPTSQNVLQSTATREKSDVSAPTSNPRDASVVTFLTTLTPDVTEHEMTSNVPLSFLCPELIPSSGSSTCCACKTDSNITQQGKRDIMTQILAGLSLNKTEVSANQRRYHSARDSRLSAVIMGYLGVALMCLVFLCILLVDIKYIFRDINYFIFDYGCGRKLPKE